MTQNSKLKTNPAAGPWITKGQPQQEGEYLIQYTTRRQKKPFISTGNYLPGTGWLNIFPGMQIVAWAKIYTPKNDRQPKKNKNT